jgi:transposase
MKLIMLNKAIAETEYQMTLDIPIELTDLEKTSNSNAWRSYRERNEKLISHRAQAFSLILGQCTRLLQDKMKQDSDWLTVNTSFDHWPSTD